MEGSKFVEVALGFVERRWEGVRQSSPVLTVILGFILLAPVDEWIAWQLFDLLKGEWLLGVQIAFGIFSLFALAWFHSDLWPFLARVIEHEGQTKALRQNIKEATSNPVAEAVLAYLTFISRDAIWVPEKVAREARVLTRLKLVTEIHKQGTQSFFLIDRRVANVIASAPSILPHYNKDRIDAFLNETEEWLELAYLQDGPYSTDQALPTLIKRAPADVSESGLTLIGEDGLDEDAVNEFKKHLTQPK